MLPLMVRVAVAHGLTFAAQQQLLLHFATEATNHGFLWQTSACCRHFNGQQLLVRIARVTFRLNAQLF